MAKRKQRFYKKDQQELLDMLVKRVYKQAMSNIQEQVQKGKDQGKTSKEINVTIADTKSWRDAAYFLNLLGCKGISAKRCAAGKEVYMPNKEDYNDGHWQKVLKIKFNRFRILANWIGSEIEPYYGPITTTKRQKIGSLNKTTKTTKTTNSSSSATKNINDGPSPSHHKPSPICTTHQSDISQTSSTPSWHKTTTQKPSKPTTSSLLLRVSKII